MIKKTARRVVEYSAAAFIQTILLVIFYPSFRAPLACFVAAVSLVACLVTVFEHFYKDPAKDPDDDRQ